MVSNILATFIICIRNAYLLAVRPYRTMRSIASKPDTSQAAVILIVAGIYFIYAAAIRAQTLNPLVISTSSMRTLIFFLLTFASTIGFMWIIGKILQRFKLADPHDLKVAYVLSSYSLIPTSVWFFITSSLYVLFPPPRYDTFLGTTFSILFIIFSCSILVWRIILWYLTIRFSLKAQFMTILLTMSLYAVWFIPYTFLMYTFRISRIPFI